MVYPHLRHRRINGTGFAVVHEKNMGAVARHVLDEPLSSLDRAGIDLFEALLREHVEAGGLAIMSTHHRLALDGADVQRLELAAP